MAEYIVSGDAALSSGGRDEDVTSSFCAVETTLASSVINRRDMLGSAVFSSRDIIQVGAYK